MNDHGRGRLFLAGAAMTAFAWLLTAVGSAGAASAMPLPPPVDAPGPVDPGAPILPAPPATTGVDHSLWAYALATGLAVAAALVVAAAAALLARRVTRRGRARRTRRVLTV